MDITYCEGKGCSIYTRCVRHVKNTKERVISLTDTFINSEGSCDYLILKNPEDNDEDTTGGYGDLI